MSSRWRPGQYYGNPRNAFWPITSALFGFDAAGALRNPAGRIAIPRRGAVGCAAQVPPRRQLRRQDSIRKAWWPTTLASCSPRTASYRRGCASTAALRSDCSRDWSTSTRRSAISCCRPPARRARCRAGQKLAGLAGDRTVMTPAAAAAPTVGPPRSARSATAASPRRYGRPTS